jgi:hypothetical protein
MLPPISAHNDIIVYDNVLEHVDIDEEHENLHHKNDSEHDKNTEHHHHCSLEFSSILAISFLASQFQIIPITFESSLIGFYQTIYNSSYLDGIFQPPRV